MPITIARSPRVVTTTRPLAGRWFAAVRDGDGWDAAYATAIKVLDAAARAGWTWDDVVHLFNDSALYKDAYLTRSDDGSRRNSPAASDRFRHDWDDALDLIERTAPIVDKIGAYAKLLQIRDAADRHQWTGRTQLCDRIVLNALLDVADTLGTVNPQVSARTLCEDTPYMERRRISRALLSLAGRGWLTIDRSGLDRSEPSIYRLKIPTGLEGGYVVSQDIAPPPVGTSGTVRTPLAERVTPSAGPKAVQLAMALTPHQQAVYAALTNVPKSRNQIVKRSGISRPTTSRALPALALAGLARQSVGPNGEVLGWVRGDTDPDVVVFERGVEFKEEARRDRHKAQRKDWKDHYEGRATDRQKALARADDLRQKREAGSLQRLAERTPKPLPKWREDAAAFNAAVWDSVVARRATERDGGTEDASV